MGSVYLYSIWKVANWLIDLCQIGGIIWRFCRIYLGKPLLLADLFRGKPSIGGEKLVSREQLVRTSSLYPRHPSSVTENGPLLLCKNSPQSRLLGQRIYKSVLALSVNSPRRQTHMQCWGVAPLLAVPGLPILVLVAPATATNQKNFNTNLNYFIINI